MSVVVVLRIEDNILHVKGLDMLDGTPILDIKPHIEDETSCPSYEGERSPGTP
jgi:tRNA (Thr-GGU) A37 N-methylase